MLFRSTVLRNLGVGMGYSLIAYQSTIKGLGKLELNETLLAADLDQAWEVLAEPIQTLMRQHGIEEPYEKLKNLTRGQTLDQAAITAMLEDLALPEEVKEQIRNMTPAGYTGNAAAMARRLLNADAATD